MKANKHDRELLLYLFRNKNKGFVHSAYDLTMADPKRTGHTTRYLTSIKNFCKTGNLKATKGGYIASDYVMKFIEALESYEILNKPGFMEQVIDILFPSKKMRRKKQIEKIEHLLQEHIDEGTAMHMINKGFFGSELAHQVVNEKLIEKADEKLKRNIRK